MDPIDANSNFINELFHSIIFIRTTEDSTDTYRTGFLLGNKSRTLIITAQSNIPTTGDFWMVIKGCSGGDEKKGCILDILLKQEYFASIGESFAIAELDFGTLIVSVDNLYIPTNHLPSKRTISQINKQERLIVFGTGTINEYPHIITKEVSTATPIAEPLFTNDPLPSKFLINMPNHACFEGGPVILSKWIDGQQVNQLVGMITGEVPSDYYVEGKLEIPENVCFVERLDVHLRKNTDSAI